MPSRVFLLMFGALLCGFGGQVAAQLAQNLTLGNAKALAFANAVTADPPGIDAIHFNPAGLALLEGRQYQLKIISGHFTIAGELTRSQALQDLLDNSLFNDPIPGGKTETSEVAAMLPFKGLTEMSALLAPLGGFSVSAPQSRVTFASAVYAPMMIGYSRGKGDIARYQGNAMGFTHLTYLSPSIGLRLTDEWMVGAALAISYTGVGLDMDMRAPNVFLGALESISDLTCEGGQPVQLLQGVLDLCQGKLGPFADVGNLRLEVEKSVNPSFNLGVLWQPMPWLSWGAVYQAEVNASLKGDFAFSYSEDWVGFFQGLNASSLGQLVALGLPIPKGVEQESGTAELDFIIPAHFSTGISVQLLPDWKMNVDVKWTDTASWNEFEIEFDRDLDFLNILSVIASDTVTAHSLTFPRGYESTWSWAAGFEYQYSERLAIRIGYEDRPSAIPEDKADLMAPFGEAFLFGLGFAYQWDKDALLEISSGYLKSEVDVAASVGGSSGGGGAIIYNPYAGYDMSSSVTTYMLQFSYQSKF